MGILEFAKPAIFICTRDRARATVFYGETLGLMLAREDNFAAVFNTGGVTLRVSFVADFKPHEHTILGFNVPDVKTTVRALREKGITFNFYPGFSQDELGILTLLEGAGHVAWFNDPDLRLRPARTRILAQALTILSYGCFRPFCPSSRGTVAGWLRRSLYF